MSSGLFDLLMGITLFSISTLLSSISIILDLFPESIKEILYGYVINQFFTGFENGLSRKAGRSRTINLGRFQHCSFFLLKENRLILHCVRLPSSQLLLLWPMVIHHREKSPSRFAPKISAWDCSPLLYAATSVQAL